MEETNASSGTRSLTSLAFDRLRAAILSGELKPNERLRVQHLSERYSVGPTAIREALSRLVPEGFVVFEDQKGFCVPDVSQHELLDLTNTRIWIEKEALTRSMKLGDVEWETNVMGSFHRLSRMEIVTGDAESLLNWRMAHRQFHFSLIQGCDSPCTIRLCSNFYDQTERYRSLSARATKGKKRDVHDEHRKLMEAVLDRDVAAACELLADHFQNTTSIILSGSDFVSHVDGGSAVTKKQKK